MNAIETMLRDGPGGDAAAAAQRLADRAAREGVADVAYSELDSPVGRLLVAATVRGLACVAYTDAGQDAVLERLAARLSPRIVRSTARTDAVARELDEYFTGRRTRFDVALDWSLVGDFGRRVLGATAAIPFGDVSTYAQIAALAGSPRGSRATGNALGANPMPIVVPCHRVLRSGGGLGGYTGGLERKRWLLGLEGVDAG